MPRRRPPLTPPIAHPFLIALAALLGIVVLLVELDLVEYAFHKIGIRSEHVFGLLLLSLLGGYVNIPIVELEGDDIVSEREVSVFGVRYVIPGGEGRRTLVAVNVGGAVIPAILSLYLLVTRPLPLGRSLLAVAFVAAVVHVFARPVKGVGVVVPVAIPPLAAAGMAFLLEGAAPAPTAYVAGTLGTLVGADLLNLGRIRRLGAPLVSIGGAGTFDGIFVTGILAVLLA